MKRIAALMVLLVLVLASPALASEAKAEVGPITYRFEGAYRGAFHDSRVAWNRLAERHGAPLIRYDRDGRDVYFVVRSVCNPGGHTGEYAWRNMDVLTINRCADLSWRERRKVYSHELGHALLGEGHRRGLTVMREFLDEQRVLYPGRKDERALARYWN